MHTDRCLDIFIAHCTLFAFLVSKHLHGVVDVGHRHNETPAIFQHADDILILFAKARDSGPEHGAVLEVELRERGLDLCSGLLWVELCHGFLSENPPAAILHTGGRFVN